MPTKQNGFASLKNTIKVIRQFIPEVKDLRNDGGPVALPIFFNEHKPSIPSIQRAQSEIKTLITIKKGDTTLLDHKLLPYYYPKSTKGNLNTTIFSIPYYEIVSSAAFSRVPAVLRHSKIADYYLGLAREYLLYE